MKLIFTIVACLVFTLNNHAQDIITKKNGDDIKAKVLEVTQNQIKYKKFENPNGPTYVIVKTDLIMVRFEDGTKEIFNEKNTTFDNVTNDNDMENQGRNDANVNYRGQNSGAVWTAATVFLTSPLFGLIPAVACSSTEPSDENLNSKNTSLMNNNTYNNAYRKQAHKIKRRKVWTGYGIGAGFWALFIILLTS